MRFRIHVDLTWIGVEYRWSWRVAKYRTRKQWRYVLALIGRGIK